MHIRAPLLAVLCALALLNCTPRPASPAAADTVAFRPARDSGKIAAKPIDSVTTTDSVIRIPLKSGDSVVLMGHPNGGDQETHYYYKRHLSAAPFYLVEVQYYESHGYLLIHDSTGRQTRLRSDPIFSPDDREILAFDHAWTAETGPSLIVISTFAGDSLVQEYRWEQEVEGGWGPDSARWTVPDTIRLVMGVPEGNDPEAHLVPSYLAREGGRWVLRNAPTVRDSLN